MVAPPAALPAPESVDAVIFDAGGVLLLPDARVGQTALSALGGGPRFQDWPRAYYSAGARLDSMDVADWGGLGRGLAAAVGVPEAQLDAAAPLIEQLIVLAPWAPVDGAVDVLRSLEAAGYKLGVVSNAFGTVERQLEELRVCSVTSDGMPRVGTVIDSHLVGIEKPDPRIFHLALEALGTEASRSIYVGDTVKFDVLGAEAAGLHPVHFDPYHLCGGVHSHISALVELSDWLVAN